ncbi:hypothetical protein FRX31_026576 [Thalictrum thalictroides]|uniref:Uncharacterized protein n=1 Tax=Thalictrum thalictroides TaxID=46969 RepID=A0A7J6VGU7_THATH|nr:hypothetical protein FRX31_026576 [Thalictrum thalictroides]
MLHTNILVKSSVRCREQQARHLFLAHQKAFHTLTHLQVGRIAEPIYCNGCRFSELARFTNYVVLRKPAIQYN